MSMPRIQLFVAGASARGARAREVLFEIKERDLGDKVQVEVIDIHADPASAFEHRVIATPMLLKNFGQPPHRICGELCNRAAILSWLDREPAGGDTKEAS